MSVLPSKNKNVKINIHLQQKIQQRLSLLFSINGIDIFMTIYHWNTRNSVALSEKITSIWSREPNKTTVNKLIAEDKLLDELCSQLLAEEERHALCLWRHVEHTVVGCRAEGQTESSERDLTVSLVQKHNQDTGTQKLNSGLLFRVKEVFLSLRAWKTAKFQLPSALNECGISHAAHSRTCTSKANMAQGWASWQPPTTAGAGLGMEEPGDSSQQRPCSANAITLLLYVSCCVLIQLKSL